MKQDPNYVMTLEDYEDVERYCHDVLEIIDRLTAGECFVKGLLHYELVQCQIKLAELRRVEFDEVSRIEFCCVSVIAFPSLLLWFSL